METPLWFWVAFTGGVLGLLALDLFVFHREAHAVSIKESAAWTTVWVTLSLIFGAWIGHWRGTPKALEFFTGYLIEYSLSVDNIFVFVMIFTYFRVAPEVQHRVLFWGIIGALVMRGVMILVGTALIARFEWILYLFGAFLVFTGIKMFFFRDEKIELEHNIVLRLCRKLLPLTPEYHGQAFLIRDGGRRLFTPLAVVLIMVESTDLIFAVDSIPAIFAITQDPFIVFTSNVCAILGLRSLYFLLGGIVDKFIYLKAGLSIVLTFIGVKMLLAHYWKIPTGIALGVVAFIIATSVVMSLVAGARNNAPAKDA